MRGWLVRIIVGLLPLAIILAAIPLSSGSLGSGSIDRHLAEYRDAGYIDHSYDELVWHIAQPYVWHSALERTMTINSARVPSGLNFYVLRQDPAGYFGQFSCNCVAVFPGDTIVCDVALLDYIRDLLTEPRSGPAHQAWLKVFLEERRSSGQSTSLSDQEAILADFDQVALIYTQALLRWVIGHEIGHISLDHFEVGFDWTKPTRQLEEEADAFVVDKLSANGTGADIFRLTLMLESAITTLYVDALRQTNPGAVPDLNKMVYFPETLPPVTVAEPGHHPPLLLRALSMWKRLGSLPNYGYIPDSAQKIEKNISIGQTGTRMTFCQSSPTALHAHFLGILPEYAPDVDYINSLFSTGLLYADMIRYAEAEDFFSTAIDVADQMPKDNKERVALLGEAYEWRGTIRYIRRNHRDSLYDLDKAIQLNPRQPRVHALAGWNRLALGEIDAATASWQMAIKLDPGYADAFAGLAIAEMTRGHTARSVEAYHIAIKYDPGYTSDSWLRYSRFWAEDAIRRISQVRQAAGS